MTEFLTESTNYIEGYKVFINKVDGGVVGESYAGATWRYVIFDGTKGEVGRGEFQLEEFVDHHAAAIKAVEFFDERQMRTAKLTVEFVLPATGTLVRRTFFHTFSSAELTTEMIEHAGGHFQIEAGDFIVSALALAAGE